jgi:hypothetical protein
VIKRTGRPHGLNGELILSLTSYPPRFPTLHLVLACLLRQTVTPDRLLLWIATDDLSLLPREVRRLQDLGVEIVPCEDLKSFKKLIPALKAFPDAFIATVDDDVAYPPDLLERLVRGAEENRSVITCNRAHRVKRRPDGSLAPFRDWQFNVADEAARRPSTDIIPLGVGGILYPPRALHPMVDDAEMFQRLCPHGDDLWFYWCARALGTHYKKVGSRMGLPLFRGSQQSSLFSANVRGGNDRMIAALEEELGPPEPRAALESGG